MEGKLGVNSGSRSYFQVVHRLTEVRLGSQAGQSELEAPRAPKEETHGCLETKKWQDPMGGLGNPMGLKWVLGVSSGRRSSKPVGGKPHASHVGRHGGGLKSAKLNKTNAPLKW